MATCLGGFLFKKSKRLIKDIKGSIFSLKRLITIVA
jgi:hypothetical protein